MFFQKTLILGALGLGLFAASAPAMAGGYNDHYRSSSEERHDARMDRHDRMHHRHHRDHMHRGHMRQNRYVGAEGHVALPPSRGNVNRAYNGGGVILEHMPDGSVRMVR